MLPSESETFDVMFMEEICLISLPKQWNFVYISYPLLRKTLNKTRFNFCFDFAGRYKLSQLSIAGIGRSFVLKMFCLYFEVAPAQNVWK